MAVPTATSPPDPAMRAVKVFVAVQIYAVLLVVR